MKKRRYIWTPDELCELAEASYEAVFGEKKSVEVEAKVERPIPTLLPKPVRSVQTVKGTSATVTELRKAQVPPSGGSLEIGNYAVKSSVTISIFSSPFGGIPRNWKPAGRWHGTLEDGGMFPLRGDP